MKLAFFHTKSYEEKSFKEANLKYKHEIEFFDSAFNKHTVALCKGYESICVFVNDPVDKALLNELKSLGVKYVLLRCAGFNHVDIKHAQEIGIKIARVPAYSPHSVAEHTMGLILSLNRKLHRAYNRVRENNFSIDGLMGFDLKGKTIGVIGTGKIGEIFCKIAKGFSCEVLCYDPQPSAECEAIGCKSVDLDTLYKQSDIISLHCPLNTHTEHLIDQESIEKMKDGVMLINTSRGGLIDTKYVVDGLKCNKIGYLGLDVYEEEGDLFFEDLSSKVIKDDTFSRLLTFPNVLITGHQAFFTQDAMQAISNISLQNLKDFEESSSSVNEVNCL